MSVALPDQIALLDTMSSEADVFAVLSASEESGSQESIAAIEASAGIAPGRLVEDAAYLARTWRAPATDGHVQLALDLLRTSYRRGLHLRSDGRDFHSFDGQVWRPGCRNALKQELHSQFVCAPANYGDGKATTIVAGALRVLETTQFSKGFPRALNEAPPNAINTRAGEIWFSVDGDWERRPHRCWSRLTTMCPVELDVDADCPRFDAALAEIFARAKDPEAMVRHFLELMAYGIQPRRDIPAIAVLRGAGANGKSMLLRIWAAIVGEDQVLWGSVARLSSDKFTLPDLAGRNLFIDDDAKDGVRLDDGLLKSIAEAKPISARRAHSPTSVSFQARALPVISMNGAPTLSDSSHGFKRRLLVVPFDRRFSEAEMDRDLAKRIIADELPGVLNRLLDAYRRLRLRGWFEEPADCITARAELLAASNPMRAFLSQACRGAPGKRVSTNDLYAAFRGWCRADGRTVPYTRIAFTQRLRGMGFSVYKSIGRNCVQDLEIGEPATTEMTDGGDA